MSVRTDVLVTGPIPNDSIFALGGFASPIGKGIQWTSGYSLYLRKDDEVVLSEGWKTALDYPELPFKMIYFTWKSLSDPAFHKEGVRLPFVLEVYDETKTRLEDVYLGYDSCNERLFLGKLTNPNLDFIFDLSRSLYDWNDGSSPFSLQAWNVMGLDASTIIPYIPGYGKQNGFVTGYAPTSIRSVMNFIPIPIEWKTKGNINTLPKSLLEIQQCYRYAQSGNDVCKIGSNYDSYKGNTNLTIARNVNYLPYFISNLGCGEKPVTQITDTLGNPILVSTGYGSGGTCIRNSNLNLQLKESPLPPSPEQPSPCKDCNPINYPEAFKRYCPACPVDASSSTSNNSNMMTSTIWFWVLISIFILIVIILIAYLVYYVNKSKRVERCSKLSQSSSQTDEKPFVRKEKPSTKQPSQKVQSSLPPEIEEEQSIIPQQEKLQPNIPQVAPESYIIASHPPPVHIGNLHHYQSVNRFPIYDYDLSSRPPPEYAKVPPIRSSSQ